MKNKPNSKSGETLRLQTLNSLRILDTPDEERFDRITRLAQRLLNVPIVLFSLVDENRIWVKSRQGLDAAEISRHGALCEYALGCDTAFVVKDASKDARLCHIPVVTEEPGIRFFAGSPISAKDGSRVGTLSVLDTVPRQIETEDVGLLSELAQMIEGELSNLTLATTDDLTKLANRRGFRMIAEPMIALCQRAWYSATVVLFDLDGLKKINDELGHQLGDTAITDFARLLLKSFRDSDVVARLGGDEFCVLLTCEGDGDSKRPLERFQHHVDSYNVESKRPFTLKFSAGSVAFQRRSHAGIEDLLHDADRQMYLQKRSKNSRVR